MGLYKPTSVRRQCPACRANLPPLENRREMRAAGRTAKQIDQQTVTCPACGKRMARKSLREKSKLWWGSFRHPVTDELKRVPLKVSDKTAATTLLAAAQRRAALEHAGLVSKFEVGEKRPLTEHIDNYETSLRNRNRAASYIRTNIPRIRKLVKACGFVYWTDITAEQVEEFIAGARDAGVAETKGKRQRTTGDRTRNFYVTAFKQLLNWMEANRRAGPNPLLSMGLEKVTDEDKRRSPTTGEVHRILCAASAEDAEPFQDVPAAERAMLYMLAASTGFRFNECRVLQWGWVDLGERPTVTLPAKHSKHRVEDVQPLSADAAAALKEWRASQGVVGPTDSVFPHVGRWHIGAELLRSDLGVAEVDFRDDAGRKLVFHSLRSWYITFIRRATDPITAAALARHKDRSVPAVTDRYSHSWVDDQFVAVNRLPKLWGVKPEVQQARATGTEAGTAPVQQTPRGSRGRRSGGRKTLQLKGLRKPPPGLEPGTCGLQNRCSAN